MNIVIKLFFILLYLQFQEKYSALKYYEIKDELYDLKN